MGIDGPTPLAHHHGKKNPAMEPKQRYAPRLSTEKAGALSLLYRRLKRGREWEDPQQDEGAWDMEAMN